MSRELEQETVSKEPVRLDAELFTSLAEDFLKRIGYDRGIRPIKATLEGETYIVEVELEDRTAKVQINTRTVEIREFEIQEKEEETGFPLSTKKLLFMVGISASAVAIIVLKFLGILVF